MRNKEIVIKKLERIESALKAMNYHIGVLDRTATYEHMDKISSRVSEIKTFLNTETQD